MASPFILKKSAAGEHRESVPAACPFVDLLGFSLMAELLAHAGGAVGDSPWSRAIKQAGD
jgi:hypothetical protein